MDDKAARLACYDSHNPPHKSAARTQGSAPPAARANATAAAASRTEAGSDFGLTPKREPEPAREGAAEPTDLIALVASVSARATGELLLKLDNGQTWVQAQRKPGAFIKANERVTIARGTFGGYLLSSDSGVTMRVRRLE
ncbi:MAG: hypothetical protein WDO56_26430 [Gammaproteobacteria bacterium]